MARLVSKQDGNFTAATTWYVVDETTAPLISESNSTSLTTTYAASSAFTVAAGDYAGFMLRASGRSPSPGAATMSVRLTDNSGVEITGTLCVVDVADIPQFDSGLYQWLFFKFSSPVTLAAATNYKIEAKTSTGSMISLTRDATTSNWSRMLVKDANPGSVAAGDDFFIVGSITNSAAMASVTVTMDSTATTDYGSAQSAANAILNPAIHVGTYGTLTWGTSAATNYRLKLSGVLDIRRAGTVNIGTTGTPIPRDSTAYLEFDSGTDSDYGIYVLNGGTLNIQGLSRTSGKNVVQCLLNTDEAANSTSLGVSADTGWLDNDVIAVASTSRTASECEVGALNGNAGASSLTVDGFGGTGGGLAYAHSGTAPTQAEVILLTRNVKIHATSSTLGWFFFIADATTVDLDWCQITNLGGSNTSPRRGMEVNRSSTTGSLAIDFCSMHDCRGWGFLCGNSNCQNVTLRDSVVWNTNTAVITGVTGGWSCSASTSLSVVQHELTRVTFVGVCEAAAAAGVILATSTQVTDVRYAGGNTNGASKTSPCVTTDSGRLRAAIDGLVVHSCNGWNSTTGGTVLFAQTGPVAPLETTIKNISVWRNANGGLFFSGIRALSITGLSVFGNQNRNIVGSGWECCLLQFDNLYSESSYATATAFTFTNSNYVDATIDGVDLSGTGAGRAAHTTDISGVTSRGLMSGILFRNSKFGAATLLSNYTAAVANAPIENAFIRMERFNQTDGDHRSYYLNGATAITDTVIYKTASPSIRITPVSGAPDVRHPLPPCTINDGQAATYKVNVRYSKNTDAGGANYTSVASPPRLYVKANPLIGITEDTLLATHSGAADWVELSGTTGTAVDNGTLEFYLRVDGSAGWVNVDDVSVTLA